MENYVILKENQPAIYKVKNNEERVFLCSIKRDTYNKDDFIFYLRDSFGNYKARKFIASATIGTCLVLEDPIFVDEFNYKDNIFKLKSQNSQVKITQPIGVKSLDEVLKNKAERDNLSSYFKEHVLFNGEPLNYDDEQLNAILSNQNTLITARAGSGKTRVIVGKIIKLLELENIKPDQIFAFTFNKDAKEEINKRLNLNCLIDNYNKYENLDIAKTFHSFALSLFDIGEESIIENKIGLIKLIINNLKQNNKTITNKIYDFFRNETLRIDHKTFNDIRNYYTYVRNSKYITLNNEKVKSIHEKYIADFLFEHGIDYVYEKSFYPCQIDLSSSNLSKDEQEDYKKLLNEKKETHPDFYLPQYNIIWEHWAVNGMETDSEIRRFENEIGSYKDYLSNKEWKRKFWNKKWISKLSKRNKYNEQLLSIKTFLETHYADFKDIDRVVIENKLKDLLSELNIPIKRLPTEVLENKVWEKRIDGFTTLIEQFINKLQQNYFKNIDNFEEIIENTKDEKTKVFYQIGYKVYTQYKTILHDTTGKYKYLKIKDYNTDFNELIYKAALKIEAGHVDKILKNLKWILIDEYQDFSKLFDYLIQSIIKRNPNVKVFCVGDNWQAINRFAGSNLRYYNEFTTNFKDSIRLDLSTNYRSLASIVDFANKFARKFNFHGTQQKSKSKLYSFVRENDISNVFADIGNKENRYLKLLDDEEPNKFEKARYLIECERIIRENIDSKIYILNRSNTLLGMELTDFNRLLRKLCLDFMSDEKYKNNIHIKTVHKSKGEEADVVILLNVNEGSFPIYNSNNALFTAFGETLEDAVKDEERLYYVALTRAKQKLQIYYREKNISSFISFKNSLQN